MKLYSFFLFLTILLSSCFSGERMKESCSMKKDKAVIRIADEVISKHKDFRHIGIGGSIKGENSEFFMAFEVDRVLEKEEMRYLLIEIVNISLKHLNKNKDLKKHLNVDSFKEKNLKIRIAPLLNGSKVRDPKIGSATLMNEVIYSSSLKFTFI